MEDPNIYASIDYSEKSDVLSLDLKYKGEHFDPKTSDNVLFNSILAEKTTTLTDEILEDSPKWYNNHTNISLRWEDAQ